MARPRSVKSAFLAVFVAAAGFLGSGAHQAHAADFVPVGMGGFAFEDVNGNGIYDGSDNALDNWVMDLSDGNQVVAQTFTWGGSYAFDNVGPGTWYVLPESFGSWLSSP